MLNWDVFAGLPGAIETNFEMLCRALVRRHYGMFGRFFALANQPGVEFHLRLESPCLLGEAGRWYGWQCRWYKQPSGRAISTTRRRKIEEAIATTEAQLPEITDWVLWTRYPLTEGDQKWFYSLPTDMQLHLWTAAEVEEHLSGPAEILRATYFGELVLTPDLLRERHAASAARVKRRWQPEVHQVVNAERAIQRKLGALEAWSDLHALASVLEEGAVSISADICSLPTTLVDTANELVDSARALATSLAQTYTALAGGDYEVLRQQLSYRPSLKPEWRVLVRQLRAGNLSTALSATNVLADVHRAHASLVALYQALEGRLVAVLADAGCGKTQLAAQLTAPSPERPAGVLLHGTDLHAGHSLDDLAKNVVVNGRPVASFEALVAAVDAAGQRASRRLPIVIDGLNEAEDPRDWRRQLASLATTLQAHPYVLVICTLRSAFTTEALPDDVERLEIPDFENDTIEAVQRYFSYYRIDPADAELPWDLLRHPLTLRMFCEVTNPERKQTVGVEAMPGSLTALFDRYLEQVAERITELAPRSQRYYESDVRTAINEIGLALWEKKTTSLEIVELRRRLGDEARPWDQSIVRALEQDGVLLRVPGERPSASHVAVVFDALAGHLVADALLGEFGGRGFEDWIKNPNIITSLTGGPDQRHPLASDIFRSLVALIPRRMHRRQLWSLLEEPWRTEAVFRAAWLESAYLDHDTMSQLQALVAKTPSNRRDLFDRLRNTRAAPSYPLNTEFLDIVLRQMSPYDRDLRWTEWIRRNDELIIKDLQRQDARWKAKENRDIRDRLRARWIMWALTSTVRHLRDYATRALYWFGSADPERLFELTLDSLAVNDPYVPERMLAACYGIAMSLWKDPRGSKLRAALPAFANSLVDRMFVPGAPYPTRHALTKDYALGVISVASKVAPRCVPSDKQLYLKSPFEHLPSPFPPASEINDSDVAGAADAIHMDFANYTIGHLIPSRPNYDFESNTYTDVRRQIEYRMVKLGYSPNGFAAADRMIGEGSWRAEKQGLKTDRYGKKYAWIAYFEMYGLRLDQRGLADWRADDRTSDADIDPSFPEPAKIWTPPLPDLFTAGPTEPRAWLADGPTPDYENLLHREEVDGQQGPWLLLNGYLEQSAKDDSRRIFSFLRGLLVTRDRVEKIVAAFKTIQYPGNRALPEPREDYYTYAGEIPWSSNFARPLRGSNGKAKRDHQRAFVLHDGRRWIPGIPVEVPAYGFAWESYHSSLNQVSSITVPAPALCERLRLSHRQHEWDLFDRRQNLATMYREFKEDRDTFRSNFLYLRADLMEEYLARTNQTLVWFTWGERELEHSTLVARMNEFDDIHARYAHIHRRSFSWEQDRNLKTRGAPA